MPTGFERPRRCARLRIERRLLLVAACLVGLTATTFSQTADARPDSAEAGAPRARSGSGTAIQLGQLGGDWVRIQAAPLRGEEARANIAYGEDAIDQATMVGLIRIDSDKFSLECENLEYENTEARQILEARINVHVQLHEHGIKADCGLLIYDLAKEVITLTVDPHVVRRTPDGDVEISNWKTIVIAIKPGGKYDFSVQGGDGLGVLELSPASASRTKPSDQTSTPTAPREILTERIPAATPTPKPADTLPQYN